MSDEKEGSEERHARAVLEAGVTHLVALLSSGGAKRDPRHVREELTKLLDLPNPGHPRPEPVFVLMCTIDRVGRRLGTTVLRIANDLVRIPETRDVLPPAAVLEWARHCAAFSWRPRFELHAENVNRKAFSRFRFDVRFESSDADDYAALVATCLSIRLAEGDQSARHVAEAEAAFLASAAFTEQAAQVRDFETHPVRLQKKRGRRRLKRTPLDDRILEIKKSRPNLKDAEIAREVSAPEETTTALYVRQLLDRVRTAEKRRRTKGTSRA